MYPSGAWNGYWEQTAWGRQPMEEFELHFHDGLVTGGGVDVVGRFVFRGEYDGVRVTLVKQYVGRHEVLYAGQYDGEGTIFGRWSIAPLWSGPFAMMPVMRRAATDAPIREIG